MRKHSKRYMLLFIYLLMSLSLQMVYASNNCLHDQELSDAEDTLLGVPSIKTTKDKIAFIKENFKMTPCLLERIGDYYLEIGDEKQALKHYEQAYKKDHTPENMGKLLVKNNRYLEAIKIYKNNNLLISDMYLQKDKIFQYYKKNFNIDKKFSILKNGVDFFNILKSKYSSDQTILKNKKKLDHYTNYANKAKILYSQLRNFNTKTNLSNLRKASKKFNNEKKSIEKNLPKSALSNTFQDSKTIIDNINKKITRILVASAKAQAIEKQKKEKDLQGSLIEILSYFSNKNIISEQDKKYFINEYKSINVLNRIIPIVSQWKKQETSYFQKKNTIQNNHNLMEIINSEVKSKVNQEVDERLNSVIDNRIKIIKKSINDLCMSYQIIALKGKKTTVKFVDNIKERITYCNYLRNHNIHCDKLTKDQIQFIISFYEKTHAVLSKQKNVNFADFQRNANELVTDSRKINESLTEELKTEFAKIAYDNGLSAESISTQFRWFQLSHNYDVNVAHNEWDKWLTYVRELKHLLNHREYWCFFKSIPEEIIQAFISKENLYSDTVSIVKDTGKLLSVKKLIESKDLEEICKNYSITDCWHFDDTSADVDWLNGVYFEYTNQLEKALSSYILCYYKLNNKLKNYEYYSSNKAKTFPGCSFSGNIITEEKNDYIRSKRDLTLNKIVTFIDANELDSFIEKSDQNNATKFINELNKSVKNFKIKSLDKRECKEIKLEFSMTQKSGNESGTPVKVTKIPEQEDLCGYYSNLFLFNKALTCYNSKTNKDKSTINRFKLINKKLKTIECENDNKCIGQVKNGEWQKLDPFNRTKDDYIRYYGYGHLREYQGASIELDTQSIEITRKLKKEGKYCKAFFEDNYYSFFINNNMEDDFYVFLLEKCLEKKIIINILDCRKSVCKTTEKKNCETLDKQILKIIIKLSSSIHNLKTLTNIQTELSHIKNGLSDLQKTNGNEKINFSKAIRRELINLLDLKQAKSDVKNMIIKFVNEMDK